MAQFLVAYDICQPDRLRRVSRFLERRGIRIQKSVFRVDGSISSLEKLLDELGQRIDIQVDIVQAWRVADVGTSLRLVRGNACREAPACVFYAGSIHLLSPVPNPLESQP